MPTPSASLWGHIAQLQKVQSAQEDLINTLETRLSSQEALMERLVNGDAPAGSAGRKASVYEAKLQTLLDEPSASRKSVTGRKSEQLTEGNISEGTFVQPLSTLTLWQRLRGKTGVIEEKSKVEIEVELEKEDMAEEDKEPGVVYEINRSMWDAALLLSFSRVRISQKVVICTGLLLNLGLQLLLVLVVYFDMLDNPFERHEVQHMLEWRALVGHSEKEMDTYNGKTFVELLCDFQMPMSYEQHLYKMIHDYLFQEMPGWALSTLAIVLWVLTTTTEFRMAFEQTFAICSLKGLPPEEPEIVPGEDGFKIRGISRGMRLMSIFVLSIPRFSVLIALMIVGCKYLAYTVSLSDIVLNSLALSFVMEVDELLAEVLLSRRTLMLIDDIQPIKVGSAWKYPGCAPTDILRFAICVTAILAASFLWLVPFHNNVSAAATAICGGQHDFTWKQGTKTAKQVILTNTSDWVPEDGCDRHEWFEKFHTYDGLNQTNIYPLLEAKPFNSKAARLQAVLKNAFNTCPEGQLLDPNKRCKTASSVLMRQATNKHQIPECFRFDPRVGVGTCDIDKVQNPKDAYCTWSWGLTNCKEDVGVTYLWTVACARGVETKWRSCDVWEKQFGSRNPVVNCEPVRKCQGVASTNVGVGPDVSFEENCLDSLVMAGQLVLDIANATVFEANRTTTQDALREGIARSLNVALDNVHILQVRGWPYNTPGIRRLDSSGGSSSSSGSNTGRRAQDSNAALVAYNFSGEVVSQGMAFAKFSVKGTPTNLTQETFVSKSAYLRDTINMFLDASVVSDLRFSPWPPEYYKKEKFKQLINVESGNQASQPNASRPNGGGQGEQNNDDDEEHDDEEHDDEEEDDEHDD